MKTAIATGILTVCAEATRAKVCRALALSGGGSNGAWEAGVLKGFLTYGNAADFEYEVVTGVSAGGINTMAIAGWQIGREAEMTTWISDLWNSLHTSDVWVDWSTGRADGWLIMGGAVDNSPLYSFLLK